MKNTTRYFAILMAFIFISFAVVQYNDPDPALWVSIYAVAALLSLGLLTKKIPFFVFLGSAVAYSVLAFLFLPREWHGLLVREEFITDIELARESLGLGICALTMLYYAWLSYKLRAIAA